MGNSAPEYMAYIHHLFAEHRRLNEVVSAVCEDLKSAVSADQTTSQWPKLVKNLEQLQDDLAHHFAEEEKGACIEEAVSRNPSVAPEANRLEGEHEHLLDELRGIIDTIKASASPAAAKEAAANFNSFAEALLAHEAAETRIMEQGFNVDLDLQHG